jgi:N-acetylglucosamine kinase-like BadF-type ATPase
MAVAHTEYIMKPNSEGESVGYVLGVDGGGTNTRAAIFSPEGEQVGEGHADAANFLRISLDVAVEHILQAVDEACGQAGITRERLSRICIGLAGVQHPEHHKQMWDALLPLFGHAAFRLETDARIALAGATDLAPGVVVIAGTGSIALGMNARGVFKRSGGWGSTIGDEGSGYYIGRRALQSVVLAYDHRSEPTTLTQRILGYFNIQSAEDLPAIIYRPSTRVVQEIAQLSKVVAAAAREGDEAAQDILDDAGYELACAVNAVIKQLGMQEEAFRVAYVGGIFNAGELILPKFSAYVKRFAPHATVGPPLFPPVIGAVKLAKIVVSPLLA